MYGAYSGQKVSDSTSTFSLANQLVANASNRWWEKPKDDEPLPAWQVCHDKDGMLKNNLEIDHF